jgi:hypothetical protein
LNTYFTNSNLPIIVYGEKRKILSNYNKIPYWFFNIFNNNYIITRIYGTNIKIYKKYILYEYDVYKKESHMIYKLSNILNIKFLEDEIYNIYAIIYIKCNIPLKYDILSDIIMNNKKLNNIIALRETTKVSSKWKKIIISSIISKIVIMGMEDNHIKIRISSYNSYYDLLLMSLLSHVLIEIYNKEYFRVNKIYKNIFDVKEIDNETNKLRMLRKEVPDLFICNYSRECPILPIIANDDDIINKKCLFYEGVYYTAPYGYYVGLKRNRLLNKDKYRYLVTAYKTDHSIRTNTATYEYLYNKNTDVTKKNPKNKYNIKSGIYFEEKHKYDNFGECIEIIFGSFKHSNVDICKQELWYMDNIEINKNIDGELYYRCFEEKYKCNIILLVYSKGDYTISIPHHKDKYFWNIINSKYCVIIIKVLSPYHMNEKEYYEIACSKGSYIYNINNNNICKQLLDEKLSMTYRGIPPKMKNIYAQYINIYGKCVSVIDKYGNEERCNYRPLNIKIYTPNNSIIYNHYKYLSTLYKLEWNNTNNKIIYFPTRKSSIRWKIINKF